MSVAQTTADTSGVLRAKVIPVVAYSLIFTLLFFIPNLLPLYTGILIDAGGMSPSQAGGVNSTYLGGMTVAAIGATFLVTKISPRKLAFLATILQTTGFCYPLVFAGGEGVLVGMAVAGLGNGALFAVANAAGALEKYPVLVFGAGMVLANVVSAAVPTPLYAAVETFGLRGLFITPLAIIPLILASLLVLPRKVATVTGTPELPRTLQPRSVKTTSILLLSGIFLTSLFNMVYYAYSDRLLVRANFDVDAIAVIFTVVYLTAAIGGVIAMVMAGWQRHLASGLVVITALLTLSVVIATTIESPPAVAVAVNLAGMISIVTMAVQPAVAAQIDATGRLAAAASGALIASMALGPIVGGWVLEAFGFPGITTLSIILGLLAIALVAAVYLRRKTATEEPLPAAVPAQTNVPG